MYIARRGFVWWAVLPQSEVHDDAKTLKLMRDQLVKLMVKEKKSYCICKAKTDVALPRT